MTYQTRWSYTGLTAFENCKHKFYRTKVLKDVAEVFTQERSAGVSFHGAAEEFFKSGGTTIDMAYLEHKPMLDAILDRSKKATEVNIETGIAVDNKWQQTQFNYRNKDMWAEAKPDVMLTFNNKILMFDFKTGKVRKDTEQLKLYATIAMSVNPNVEAVMGAYIYIAHNSAKVQVVVKREEVPGIQQEFNSRVIKIYKAHETGGWMKEPNPLCGWCPVLDCEHNTKRG